ncbi:MAG TPA: heme-binding domain-containing protein [Actinomycetota bacterium]
MRRLPRWMRRTFWIGLGLFALIQLVPYGRDHANPAVTRAASFGSQAGTDLARGACLDCHSNETTWPWYSNVAPMSWLIQKDVDEGRDHLNFSEWNRPQEGTEELLEVVEEGEMPPVNYTLLHPDARLTEEERATLLAALQVALAEAPPAGDDNSGPG